MQASYAIPSIFPMQMHPRRKADRMFARQLKCKKCSSGLRWSMRNREQEANRMHPFDAKASEYVRSVMCVFENRAKFERVLRRRSIVVGDMKIMCKEKGCLSVRLIVMCIICDRLSKYFLSFVLLCWASAIKRVWSRIPDPRKGNAIDLLPRRTIQSG
jgi:hypothetical protein